MRIVKVSIFLLLVFSNVLMAEIYRYKDESGQWVYTDVKPRAVDNVEKVDYKAPKKKLTRPYVYIRKNNNSYELMVKNPWYAPVEIKFKLLTNEKTIHKKIVPAAATISLIQHKNKSELSKYRYSMVLGKSTSSGADFAYQMPITSKKQHRITQAFNGPFSHFQEPNVYSVDIAMQVGTYISAARAGTVIWVKDDYHMGGSKSYFLDKANYVSVLHEDGTYAVYAHILLGSALVKPGDVVAIGDQLARSGSSGFSTGPHLHFVIRKNEDFKTASVPFHFLNNEGQYFLPKRGQMISGINRN